MMAKKRNAGPMTVQPQRAWATHPVADNAPAKKSLSRSNGVNATRARQLRQRALRTQRAMLTGKTSGHGASTK
jgi:hypothetical protein